MKVLLDTHAFLWWVTSRGSRLSEVARDVLSDGTNEVAVSMASVWEMSIKVGIGRVELPDQIDRYVPDRLRHHGFDLLPVEIQHTFRAGDLPRIHGDPFDRMLIAQAQIEGLALLTANPAIGRYEVETIW